MPIPGYKAFNMACELFSDLFPRSAKMIDGDDPRMVKIDEALQKACEYGEGIAEPEAAIYPSPGCMINVVDRRDRSSLGTLEMDADYNLDFVRLDGVNVSLTQDDELDKIFTDIFRCRRAQNVKWGGPEHDDAHHRCDWTRFMVKFIRRAEDHVMLSHAEHSGIVRQPAEVDDVDGYESNLIHVAALAVAALESSRRRKAAAEPSQPDAQPIAE